MYEKNIKNIFDEMIVLILNIKIKKKKRIIFSLLRLCFEVNQNFSNTNEII